MSLIRRPGQSKLTQPQDKEARALLFMLERIKGKTVNQIAKEYHCGPTTVMNVLDRARKESLVLNKAKEIIGDQLVPLALMVYEAHLHAGSLQAAQDIMFGFGALQKTSNVKHETHDAVETLDAFRDNYFKAKDAVLAQAPQMALPSPQDAPDSHQPAEVTSPTDLAQDGVEVNLEAQ